MEEQGGLGGGGGMEYTESHVARLLNTDWRPKMSFLRSCNVQKLDVPRGMGSLQLVIY